MPFWTNCQLVDKFAENGMNPHTLMFEHSTLPLVSKQGGLYASFFRVLVIVRIYGFGDYGDRMGVQLMGPHGRPKRSHLTIRIIFQMG